jgi:rfaE bifunctional protein nucleotidyltransferase chain/domain
VVSRRGRGPLVVVGDTLLDRDLDGRVHRLCPDAPVPVLDDPTARPRPGGAGLAALLAAWDGRDVVLVTAIGTGPAADELRALLVPHVRLVELPRDGGPAQKTRLRADGRALLRVDHPAGGGIGTPHAAVTDALAAAGAVLVSDYGGGVTAREELREAIRAQIGRKPIVWDPHPRGTAPLPGTDLVTPNLAEAAHAAERTPPEPGPRQLREVSELAAELRDRWGARAVCVTLGARGAVLSRGAEPVTVPAPTVDAHDPCGAGDRFATAVCLLLADGRTVPDAVAGAVSAAADFLALGGVSEVGRRLAAVEGSEGADGAAASRHGADGWASAEPAPAPGVRRRGAGAGVSGAGVAGAEVAGAGLSGSRPVGGGAGARRNGRTSSVDWAPDAMELVRRVKARGGTVVATGGCFDLLHAGHIRTLQAARALGDALVVCLNSDASVRALKGAPRPFHSAADRAEVLRALGCVDAVVVFDEDTPERLIGELRPDVWVKGGDYSADSLPEAALVASYGGQAVTVPYLAGRSSTRIADAAAKGA